MPPRLTTTYIDTMKFNIKMPPEEELTAIAQSWWDALEPHCFHKWSKELLAVTYPLRMVPFPHDLLVKCLKLANGEWQKGLIGDFNALVQPTLDDMGISDRYFAKLCSRSPKDFLSDGPRLMTLNTATELLEALRGSMRCFEDMCHLVHLDVAYIVLRPFVDFEPWQEFRVFVKDGKIAGISQYHYKYPFGILQVELDIYEREIRQFINDVVIPNFPLPDFVADIIVNVESDPILLEINPYGLSDPCLFESYEALDGSMRVVK